MTAGFSQHQIDGRVSDEFGGLADRRERDHGGGREVDVVVADEGDLVRDPDAAAHHECLQYPHREEVVRGEDGIGSIFGCTCAEGLAGGTAREHAQRIGQDHFEGDAGLVRGSAGSLQAVDHLSDAHRTPDEGDASSSLRREMLHGEVATADVVDRYRGEALVGDFPVDEHHGGAAIAQTSQSREVVGERRDEQTGDALLLEEVDVGALAFDLLVAVAECDRHPRLGGSFLGAAGDVGEERVAHVEHDQAYRATVSCAQLPGGVVAHEAELLDRRCDAFDGGGRHLVRVVQDVRDGPDRDGCGECDISNTDDHGVIPFRAIRETCP